jgi:hypothetical protein
MSNMMNWGHDIIDVDYETEYADHLDQLEAAEEAKAREDYETLKDDALEQSAVSR